MQLTLVTPPAQPVISLTDAKGFLRILHSDDDSIITDMVSAVTEHVQNILNRQLGVATYELYADGLISKLPKNPIREILSIEYLDASGNYVTLDSSAYYLYERYGVGYVSYSDIPTLQEHQRALKITFSCGYDVVPQPILSYMRVKVSTLYENREEYVIGSIISEFDNKFIKNLLTSYKVHS